MTGVALRSLPQFNRPCTWSSQSRITLRRGRGCYIALTSLSKSG